MTSTTTTTMAAMTHQRGCGHRRSPLGHLRPLLVLSVVVVVVLTASVASAASATSKPDSVSNQQPAPGTSSTIQQSGNLSVTLDVTQQGVTNGPGQGADIYCFVHYGSVTGWGGEWNTQVNLPMHSLGDVPPGDAADEYEGTFEDMAIGQYEFVVFCQDGTDTSNTAAQTWSSTPGANARLTVVADPVCGDGIIETGETCDVGNNSSTFCVNCTCIGGSIPQSTIQGSSLTGCTCFANTDLPHTHTLSLSVSSNNNKNKKTNNQKPNRSY